MRVEPHSKNIVWLGKVSRLESGSVTALSRARTYRERESREQRERAERAESTLTHRLKSTFRLAEHSKHTQSAFVIPQNHSRERKIHAVRIQGGARSQSERAHPLRITPTTFRIHSESFGNTLNPSACMRYLPLSPRTRPDGLNTSTPDSLSSAQNRPEAPRTHSKPLRIDMHSE
jgi:hypothetical protein